MAVIGQVGFCLLIGDGANGRGMVAGICGRPNRSRKQGVGMAGHYAYLLPVTDGWVSDEGVWGMGHGICFPCPTLYPQ